MRSVLDQIIERNEKNLKELKELKKQTLELLNDNERRYTDRTINLIDTLLALGNPEIKVYNNLSIASFEHLIKNTDFEGYRKVLQSLDPKKAYIIKDKEELKDYMNFLQEEGEFLLHDDIQKIIVKVNDNLFYFEAI